MFQRTRIPLWNGIIHYFNENHRQGIHTTTRKGLLRYLREQGFSGSINSIDSYRNYLKQAGYIDTVRRGTYRCDEQIPSDLSVDDCRSQAYGGLTPIIVPRINTLTDDEMQRIRDALDNTFEPEPSASASSSSISPTAETDRNHVEREPEPFLSAEDMEI